MKSYINILADYREAPFERSVTVSCPEEYVKSQLKHLTRNNKITEKVDTVENGDVAILSLESELDKFNRPMIPLTVGGNLFDAEFESQLAGHLVGETFTVSVQEKTVTVTIKQASRTVFPEATDEMAAEYAQTHEDFKDVKTVEEYRNRVIEKYLEEKKQEALYNAMDAILDYVLTHSDWEFDESEISEQKETAMREIKEQLKEEYNKELEDFTEEELNSIFGISSLEEFDKELTSSMEQSIAQELWFAAENKVDSLDDFEGNPYDFLQKYVENNLNITEEK